jgi:uncharacterized membrane protein YozB (DUF420 family)
MKMITPSLQLPLSALWWHRLPAIEACLNGTSALLLVLAFILIKRGKVRVHATLMITALVTSAVFLFLYVLHHVLKGKYEGNPITPFPPGPWKPVYLVVLWPHLLLAMFMLPLIFASVWLAWKRRWKLHHKVSMVTLPIWLYVSVTGVVVYWMLYHLAPRL